METQQLWFANADLLVSLGPSKNRSLAPIVHTRSSAGVQDKKRKSPVHFIDNTEESARDPVCELNSLHVL